MNDVPETMRFVNVRSPGAAEKMEIAVGPTPRPQEGEVLIRVAAAGVNRADVMQRLGSYPPPPGASPILGLEVAGTIVAPGRTAVHVESATQCAALFNGGRLAEFCVAPAALCLPIPHGLDAIHAAALPEAFFTVWANVFRRGRLTPGEKLLVHGGSSGIGTTAIQPARALGSVVYVTAGSAKSAARCLQLGAAAAINYREHDFAQEIARLTANQGVDVILDMVGALISKKPQSAALNGRLVQIAFMQGSRAEIDLRLIMSKRLIVTGSTLRPLPLVEKHRWLKNSAKKPGRCWRAAASAYRRRRVSVQRGGRGASIDGVERLRRQDCFEVVRKIDIACVSRSHIGKRETYTSIKFHHDVVSLQFDGIAMYPLGEPADRARHRS